jgi:hypothetical protein
VTTQGNIGGASLRVMRAGTDVPLVTRTPFEILPWERGRRWKVTVAFTVLDRQGRRLTIPHGFEHDRYSIAPDLPDEIPAIAHDRAYEVQTWDGGERMLRADADLLLLDLMRASWSRLTRTAAPVYYRGVRLGGWPSWRLRGAIGRLRRLNRA